MCWFWNSQVNRSAQPSTTVPSNPTWAVGLGRNGYAGRVSGGARTRPLPYTGAAFHRAREGGRCPGARPAHQGYMQSAIRIYQTAGVRSLSRVRSVGVGGSRRRCRAGRCRSPGLPPRSCGWLTIGFRVRSTETEPHRQVALRALPGAETARRCRYRGRRVRAVPRRRR